MESLSNILENKFLVKKNITNNSNFEYGKKINPEDIKNLKEDDYIYSGNSFNNSYFIIDSINERNTNVFIEYHIKVKVSIDEPERKISNKWRYITVYKNEKYAKELRYCTKEECEKLNKLLNK